jgi:hypothetical protein
MTSQLIIACLLGKIVNLDPSATAYLMVEFSGRATERLEPKSLESTTLFWEFTCL